MKDSQNNSSKRTSRLTLLALGLSVTLGSTLAFGGPDHDQLIEQLKARTAEANAPAATLVERKLGKRLREMLRRMRTQGGDSEMVDVIVRYKARPGEAEKRRTDQLGAQQKRAFQNLKMLVILVYWLLTAELLSWLPSDCP